MHVRTTTVNIGYIMYICILTDVQVRKRTSHGPVHLVLHDTVVPPGDGSQKHSVRTIPWLVRYRSGGGSTGHAGKYDHPFYPMLSDKRDLHEDTSGFIIHDTANEHNYLYSFFSSSPIHFLDWITHSSLILLVLQ